ncbi:hypothetical protein [Draconibacterium mangrovi]|uniref:hypothetical protein n=1 Tax=Draconibacterium mangrovi TaxID=2697469 RepID=UPI0013D8036B|nr:hypothetical protein [Draconibacterium mangrovi]
MEFVKIDNRNRGISKQDNNPNINRNQKHDLEFIFKELNNETFEIGWDLIISQNGCNELSFQTTDIYEINDRDKMATETQMIELFNNTFHVSVKKYNEEKANYRLVENVLTAPSLLLHQLLPELTRLLQNLHESSTL